MVRSRTSSPDLLAEHVHDGRTRDPLENAVGGGRCQHLAAADDEDVLGAALGDVTTARQHDRLVESALQRFAFRERGVDVETRALGPDRSHRIVDAAPGRDHAADPAVADVQPHRRGHDREAVGDIVELDADDLSGLERERPDVDVLAVLVAPQQLERRFDQLLRCSTGDRHLEHASVLVHALEVLWQREREELLAFGVPVGADAFEHAGAVVEAVRQQADLGIRVADDFAVEEDPGLLSK